MHWVAWLWHWVEVHTGTVNESGPYYGFWSGFGSDIGEVTLISAVIVHFRSQNCHQKGCWRFGHATPKGNRLCKHHGAKPYGDLNLTHRLHPSHA